MAEQDKQRGASLVASPHSQGSPLGSPLGSVLSPGQHCSTMHPARLVAGNASLEKTRFKGYGTAGGGGDGGGAGGGAGSEMVEDVESWHDPLKVLVKRISDGVPAPLDAYVEGIMLEAATAITSTIITPASVVHKPAQREGAAGEEGDLEEVAQAPKEGSEEGGGSWFGGERRREGAVMRGVELILEGHFVLTLTAIVIDNPKLQREWRSVFG